jgi:hypothetical protein
MWASTVWGFWGAGLCSLLAIIPMVGRDRFSVARKRLAVLGVASLIIGALVWVPGHDDQSAATSITATDKSIGQQNGPSINGSITGNSNIIAPGATGPIIQNNVLVPTNPPPPPPLLIPSVEILYNLGAHQFEFLNRGTSNIYLWGVRYGGEIADGTNVKAPPATLAANGGTYHIYGGEKDPLEFESKIRAHEINGSIDMRIPLWVFITMDDDKQRILNFNLWIHTTNGVLKVETQNLGTEAKRFNDQGR